MFVNWRTSSSCDKYIRPNINYYIISLSFYKEKSATKLIINYSRQQGERCPPHLINTCSFHYQISRGLCFLKNIDKIISCISNNNNFNVLNVASPMQSRNVFVESTYGGSLINAKPRKLMIYNSAIIIIAFRFEPDYKNVYFDSNIN